MTISHLLPHWEYCERHGEAFRDYRMHVACKVRFATPEEIERANARWRYYNDVEYHAWIHLAFYGCSLWRRILAPVTS